MALAASSQVWLSKASAAVVEQKENMLGAKTANRRQAVPRKKDVWPRRMCRRAVGQGGGPCNRTGKHVGVGACLEPFPASGSQAMGSVVACPMQYVNMKLTRALSGAKPNLRNRQTHCNRAAVVLGWEVVPFTTTII